MQGLVGAIHSESTLTWLCRRFFSPSLFSVVMPTYSSNNLTSYFPALYIFSKNCVCRRQTFYVISYVHVTSLCRFLFIVSEINNISSRYCLLPVLLYVFLRARFWLFFKSRRNEYDLVLKISFLLRAGFRPDSIGPVDPDSESGSGSRRAKMTHKSRKNL